METVLKNVSKSPFLLRTSCTAAVDNAVSDAPQIFVILDQDVLCECSEIVNHSIFTSSLVTLMAVYYTFNLAYEDKRKNLFKFLEEHVLGVILKRKPYTLKQLENEQCTADKALVELNCVHQKILKLCLDQTTGRIVRKLKFTLFLLQKGFTTVAMKE